MSFINISKLRNAAGKAVSQAWGDDVVDNLEFLNGQIGTLQSGAILNGGFEINSNPDEPNIPDNWTRKLYGGTGVIDITNPRAGAQIFKFTHPGGAGNGGGDLLSDFSEITPDAGFAIDWVHWATLAGVHVTVLVKYYDKNQADLSLDQTLFDASSGINTAAFRFQEWLNVPTAARYFRVQLVGGDTDVDPGASTDIYFDDVQITRPRVWGPGEEIIISAAGPFSSGAGGGLQKVYEQQINRGGTGRIKFGASLSAGNNAQIYRNGSPVGTLRTTTGTYEEDIPDWQPTDLIQIYVNNIGGLGDISNVEIKASTAIGP